LQQTNKKSSETAFCKNLRRITSYISQSEEKERGSDTSHIMKTFDHNYHQQAEAEIPPQTMPAHSSTEKAGDTPTSPSKVYGNHHYDNHHHYPPPHVPTSLELEDNNSANSGGTSWTLRIPWLRAKRNKSKRRIRDDDENSSIYTNPSRRSISPQQQLQQLQQQQQDQVYYGGLMRTVSPGCAHEEASRSVAGAHQQQLHCQHLQEQPADPMEQHLGDALPEHQRLSAPLAAATAAAIATLHSRQEQAKPLSPIDVDTLPLHNPAHHPVATLSSRRYNISPNGIGGGAVHLEPKNNHKVSWNRSWGSTSSNDSRRGGEYRRRGNYKHDVSRTSDNDSISDSLADFDEAEWTPQDSAYGAAIPICGWVPKRLRQFIEATLIALTVAGLVYLVVTTSISIQESKANGHHTNYNKSYVDHSNQFDDDWYVEFSQNNNNDADDYFSSKYGRNDDVMANNDDDDAAVVAGDDDGARGGG